MMGAIIGDIVGSRFEWHNYRHKDFTLFHPKCRPTDESSWTLAVAMAIFMARPGYEDLAEQAVAAMQELGRKYPKAGYGRGFRAWLQSEHPAPYNSFGNGSAMRVSPAGFAAHTEDEAKARSCAVTAVTHNHPEGIKGAQAVAAAIFLARTGHDKAEIKAYVEREFGYDLSRSCDEIRPSYHHVESCQETVPQAIIAFLESTSFEDALRTAVSLGGDSDTLAAITGSIAEAFYGVPEDLKQECRNRLTPELEEILQACENMLLQR